MVPVEAAKSSQSIATVERAIDVLLLFARSPGPNLGVTEIASTLGISKAAVHRILTSLRHKGLLDVNDDVRRYSLGPAALEIGLAYLDRIEIRGVVAPELQLLCDATGETATLSLRSGSTRAYVSQVTPPTEVIMTVPLGRAFPLHTGSSSKAFLAFLSPTEIDRYLTGPLERLTDRTVVDPAELRAELNKIRSDGFASSLGERQEGAASVAAPVFDHTQALVAVVSVCGPIERFRPNMATASEALVAATNRLSSRLGHLPSRIA